MYTNSIIGSYNTMANADLKHQQGMGMGMGFGMRPTCHRKMGGPPRKTPSHESQITSPMSAATNVSSVVEIPQVLPGLETLTSLLSVVLQPVKVSNTRRTGFSITTPDNVNFLNCMPPPAPDGKNSTSSPSSTSSSSNSSNILQILTTEGDVVLEIKPETSYCCPWLRNMEAKVMTSSHAGSKHIASLIKTATAPCYPEPHFIIHILKPDQTKLAFHLDVTTSLTEISVKNKEEVVMNITMAKEESRSLYTVNFVSKKEDELMRIHPNLKAMLVLFAILYVQE